MSTTFKAGSRVEYKTPRGESWAPGTVIEIYNGLRGDWYTVEDKDTKAKIHVRLSGLRKRG